MKYIYTNQIGTSFFWNKTLEKSSNIQVVFRETGFYFTRAELLKFKELISQSIQNNCNCMHCDLKNSCSKFLLQTPWISIDLAVSTQEILLLKDLIEGTIFYTYLQEYVYDEGRN